MKSRQNPFQSVSRVGKTHYHPSKNQSVTMKDKQTALSPVRLQKEPTPDIQTLGPEGKWAFEKHDKCLASMDGQLDYAELWPSTNCGSSPASSITSSDMEISKQSARAGTSISFDLAGQEDSVLAKYIERFRYGRPQSREERQVMALASGEEQLPFWWISPSALPPSSTPTKTTDEDVIQSLKDDHGSAIFSPAVQHQRSRPFSPCRSLSGEFDDTEILHLQERASILLLRRESTQSDGSVPVSSEGLGCSEFPYPVSVDEQVQRPLNPTLLKSAIAKVNSDSAQATSSSSYRNVAVHSLATPTRPEEDILFQWRLRRKMEQAREWSQSVQHAGLHGRTLSWQAPSLRHPSVTGQDYKQQQNTQPPELSQKATHPHITSLQPETKEAFGPYLPASNPPPFHNIAVSASPFSHPQAIAHVPANIHFLCDVLPCPVQSSHASVQQSIFRISDGCQAKVCEKTRLHGNSAEEPTRDHVSSSPPALSQPVEGDWPTHHRKEERNGKENAQTKPSERVEKMTVASIRKYKKSTSSSMETQHSEGHSSRNTSSHQRLPKKVITQTWPHQKQGAQEPPRENCTGNDAPPPSALAQPVEGDWPSHCRKERRNRKENAQTKPSERVEKMADASIRKHKKSTSSSMETQHSEGHSSRDTSSHQRLPKKVITQTWPHQKQGAQEPPRENCTGNDAPPPSPIHSVLGQVVSEVLFPTVDSSPAPNTLVPLISPPGAMPAPPQSPVPPCSAQNSVEVNSQLLQEAEDSDEKEFEDDPLLQVLRKQRKWVKEKISEVDSMLNEFLDEQVS